MMSFLAARTRLQSAALILGLLAVLGQLSALYDPSPDPTSISLGFIPKDKVAHVLIFAVPVLLLVLAGIRSRVMPALFAVHAPVSEIIQATLLPRDGSLGDIAADLLGIALGWATGVLILRKRTAPAQRPHEERP